MRQDFLIWLWFKSGAYQDVPPGEFNDEGIFAFQIQEPSREEDAVFWRSSDETFHVFRKGAPLANDFFVGWAMGPSAVEGLTQVLLQIDPSASSPVNPWQA